MNKSHPRSTFLEFKYFIRTRAYFVLLLPVFFVLHGFVANYGAVNATDAIILIAFYIVVSIIIAAIGWLFYRNTAKAALLAFCIMGYHFFFGVIQDGLTVLSPRSVITQYRFIVPVSCLFFFAMIIWLRKRKKTFRSITSYLNILLLILILLDFGGLIIKINSTKKSSPRDFSNEAFTICDTCKKPDVYFLLLDQYAGNESLKAVFNFDNSLFEKELTQRGFKVAGRSNSNYNMTPYSMASTLNMNYLEPERNVVNRLNVSYSYGVIRNSFAINFLSANGYKFYNLSVFDFPKQPAHKYGTFLPYGTDLITAQTFLSRIKKAVRADVLSGKIHWTSFQKKIIYQHLHFNDDIYESTMNIASRQTKEPKFVYSHFMMPHFPYYYDSKSRETPMEKLKEFTATSANDYIEYLQYCNRRVLQLVDYIFSVSAEPPVIILLGDHGFRNPKKRTEIKYEFSSLNAIFLPGKNYELFTDDMTNVNFFRVFFNSCFNQRFSILKDTTINLWE